MSEIVVAAVDVDGLSAGAVELMKTAVRYACANKNIMQHTMPVDEFCRLADQFPATTEQFRTLLKEARKAVASIDVIDTVFPDRDDLPSSSWPVFKKIWTNGLQIVFEVDQQTCHDMLRESFSKNKKFQKELLFLDTRYD
jgi:hypothetical protein